jgi:Transposase DNA-binding
MRTAREPGTEEHARGQGEENWAVTEFAEAELGDARRTQRVITVATQLAQQLGAGLPEACGNGAALKATYRLLANTDDPGPELPARVVQPPALKDIEAREVLDAGRPCEPQIGGDGVALGGQGPPTSQQQESLPRGGREKSLK